MFKIDKNVNFSCIVYIFNDISKSDLIQLRKELFAEFPEPSLENFFP